MPAKNSLNNEIARSQTPGSVASASVISTSNTASAGASMTVEAAGSSSTGNATYTSQNSGAGTGEVWTWGHDNTNSRFAISNQSSIGTDPSSGVGDIIRATYNGINGTCSLNYPAQACFFATSTTQGLTSGGTINPVIFSAATFDQTNSFSASVFTAPVTGKYLFNVMLRVTGQSGGTGTCFMTLSTTTTSIIYHFPAFQLASGGPTFSFPISTITEMSLGDTAHIEFKNMNSASGSIVAADSYFSGTLLV